MDDLYRWEGIQDRAVAAIRSVAPRHTIIATAAEWGHQDGLLAMEPVRDDECDLHVPRLRSDVVYAPGRDLVDGSRGRFCMAFRILRRRRISKAVLSEEPDERVRLDAGAVRRGPLGPAAGGQRKLRRWRSGREKRNVPLYCGEFGVFKDHCDPKMRAAWINDTRTALERHHIGWAMWDYDGNFGLATKTSDGIVVDQEVLRALGMGSSQFRLSVVRDSAR